MLRTSKITGMELRKGGKHHECTACHCSLDGRPMVVYLKGLGSRKVGFQYRCWGCVTNEYAAKLFVDAYPHVFELYPDGPWTRVRIKPNLQGELFDPRYGTLNKDVLETLAPVNLKGSR